MGLIAVHLLLMNVLHFIYIPRFIDVVHLLFHCPNPHPEIGGANAGAIKRKSNTMLHLASTNIWLRGWTINKDMEKRIDALEMWLYTVEE